MAKETLEEAAERMAKEHCSIRVNPNTTEFQIQQFIIKGAKWQAERMYREEDMKSFGQLCADYNYRCWGKKTQEEMLQIWLNVEMSYFEKNKQS